MAQSNLERVGRALELVSAGLRPFVERELQSHYGDSWLGEATRSLREERGENRRDDPPNLDDPHFLLGLIWNRWNEVFGSVLSRSERSLVSEMRDARNRWAHQEPFST